LTAGAADTHDQTRHERVMFASTCGFLFLAILHLMMEFSRRESAAVEDAAAGLVAVALAIFAAATLYGEKQHALKRESALEKPSPNLRAPNRCSRPNAKRSESKSS